MRCLAGMFSIAGRHSSAGLGAAASNGLGRLILVAASLAVLAPPAFAQRADDNVVTDAEDAFGRSVGNEAIGLYSEEEVRGFSPIAAGNVRIEGLYFDQQGGGITNRLLEGSAIRVGISAQGYPFPAPTGIVDLSLRRVGEEALLSAVAFAGPFETYALELDGQLPVLPGRLGFVIGAAIRTDEGFRNGDEGRFGGVGIMADYRPDAAIRLRPFWGRSFFANDNATPIVIVADPSAGESRFLPPRIDRGFFGQEWTDFRGYLENFGLLGDYRAGNGWEFRIGLFRSRLVLKQSFADLYLDTGRDGRARHRIVADPLQVFESLSGEVRATRAFAEGPRRHAFIVALRGRQVTRRYGGSAGVDFGNSTIGVGEELVEPAFLFSDRSRDQIRQGTAALGYELRWRDRGELSLGVQRTDYLKTVFAPAASPLASRASPWLWSATLALHLTDRLALYAGYARGLEESGSAPPEAVNRSEAPPALLTSQRDGGLRYRIRDGLTFTAGVFDVYKPYFNLDGNRVFGRLGEVRHRGLEVSLAGRVANGLSLVAGAVLLDAEVSGEAVASGIIGPRPVGSARRRFQANIDYRLPSFERLSVDLSLIAFGRRAASSDNRLEVPSIATLNLGARYRFQLGRAPATLRVQMFNLFDTFGWTVTGSGAFAANGPRRIGGHLAVDF